jgi:hypothetical protein
MHKYIRMSHDICTLMANSYSEDGQYMEVIHDLEGIAIYKNK